MDKITHLKSALIALLVFGASHFPGTGFASRPFITEDAGVAGRRVVQLEASWDYIRWNNHGSEQMATFVPIFGVADEVEIAAEIPLMFHNHRHGGKVAGLGDVSIVTKFLLTDEQQFTPAVVLKTALKTTTGNAARGLGSGALDYSLVAAASKQIDNIIIHGMLGYTFIGTNGDEMLRDTIVYGMAAEYALTGTTRIVAEFAGNRHPDRVVDGHIHSAMAGAVHAFSDNLAMDISVRVGTTSTAPQWNSAVGMTWTL